MNAETIFSFLTFKAGNREWSLALEQISEVIPIPALTKVPGTSSIIPGIINLRGKILPVIDLAGRLLNFSGQLSLRSCLIIVKAFNDQEEIALAVESVSKVIEESASMVSATPEFGSSVRREFLAGILQSDNKMIPLLDLDRILNLEELIALAGKT